MTFRGTVGILCAAGLFAAAAPIAAQRGPAPAATGLSPEVLSLACAPATVYEPPAMPLRITGGQDSFVRRVFAPGDLVTINAGTLQGIDVGQEFFVRRPLVSRREPITHETPASIRTAGWIRVYAVDDSLSLATVTHACDTIEVDDYLEPLVLRLPPTPLAERPDPQRENYGRVLMGQDRRRSFAAGDYFTVDRGSDHGVAPGTQFVLYRDKRVDENFLYDLGEAVAVNVKPDSSTLRVTVARDAIAAGDYVAMRR
jgi:hypothetical protein